MARTDRSVRLTSVPRSLRLHSCVAAGLVLVSVAVLPAADRAQTGQKEPVASLRTADLFALQQRCGAAESVTESYRLFGQHASAEKPSGGMKTVAFEENRLFVYTLAATPSGDEAKDGQRSPQRIRRFFLLKPSTFVVDDVVRVPSADKSIRWLLQSPAEPVISDPRDFQNPGDLTPEIRVVQPDGEILGRTLLPASVSAKKTPGTGDDDRHPEYRVEFVSKPAAGEVRFLHVFHVREAGEQSSAALSKLVKKDDQLKLTVTANGRVFRLTLPTDSSQAGKIEIAKVDGEALLPARLLPSGIMPYGPEGVRLLERWDSPYHNNRRPGWDVGRPSTYLVEAVEGGTLRPGRAIVFGCGTGTNAIYLAGKGFDVTGVDVAPTALARAEQKARKAGVSVRWILADMLALPKLEPFDLVFDRGCYHHVRRYNAAGYVDAVRRLTHAGSRLLLLAGNANEKTRRGPPRVKEEEIRNDFSALFEFEWMREVRFNSTNPDAKGPLAWSVLLRRKDK